MDATELELRRRISTLEETVEELKERELDYNFYERVRKILVEQGLISPAAEDE